MAKEPFAAKLTSIWVGGFFFWIIKGFKGKLTDQFAKEYENRNVWVGYFITLIIACAVFYFLIKNEINI
ncbi:hypothetical protein [Flavobacterium chilense]|uniref:Uncharacterized protein n=1 Tax=Flavobacterium chilense TaxID=946677 RepID=A0A1M6XAY8_9FLAO|nr:hypothetical protein [Flavobacterium chilense]SHL03039.1 hypothetical protein SAMN05444484_10165 [Flavobacterium chilense]